MQLTKQTDYAFRVLLYLAKQPAKKANQSPQKQLIQMQQICDFYSISPNHISKIIVKLVNAGWVKSVRGKGGGIYLAIDANKINLADVVREFETTLKPVNCSEPECRISETCTLKGLLGKAMSNFINTLADYTLDDILVKELTPNAINLLEIK